MGRRLSEFTYSVMGLCFELGLTRPWVGHRRRRTRGGRGAKNIGARAGANRKRTVWDFDTRTQRYGLAHSCLASLHGVSVKDTTSILIHKATRKSKKVGESV
jgi:hypothetical protein